MSYVDAIQRSDTIITWVRFDENKLEKIEFPAPYYCYTKNALGDTKSIFGDKVKKIEFKNRNSMDMYLHNHSNDVFESDFSPLYKCLSDNFYELNHVPLNVGLFDIEAYVDLGRGEGFPMPENPYGEINSISLYDVSKSTYHMIVLHERDDLGLVDDECEVVTHHCVTERQVLDTFFRLIEDIDILSAWNGDGYDIPYIVERAIRIYGDTEGRKKLCRDGFSVRERDYTDAYGNDRTTYKLVGRIHLDYLELYKKFTFGERSSYKLDNIAELELKKKKLPYPGDLGELYRKDPKKFFEYSLHDVRLMKWLDEKLKFVRQADSMAKQATIKLDDVFGSIKYLEHSIRNYCHFEREVELVLPDKNPNAKKQDFPGAFVLETKPGVYGYTSSIDLASLYPSTIRALNISPETHLFQCVGLTDDFVKVVTETDDILSVRSIIDDEVHTIRAKDLKSLIVEQGWTISAYGSIFEKDVGLIPEVLTLWYEERKKTKKLSKEYYKKGDTKNGDYYDMQQNLRKLSLNSLYGAISNPYSRFYSTYLAGSVTASGQFIEKFQIWKSDEIIKEAA